MFDLADIFLCIFYFLFTVFNLRISFRFRIIVFGLCIVQFLLF